MSGEERTVVDDTDAHRFRYAEDGVEAELVYRATPGRLTLVHTGVPEALGGRGIGGRLVRAALERANDALAAQRIAIGGRVTRPCPAIEIPRLGL